jgi:hypothetical protein
LDVEENWFEIDFEYFSKRVWELPFIKHIAVFTPEIVWGEIFTTIKGSSRAHSFYHKYLDFETYCKESKN